ncbi:NTP transferase domain-containing protein [Paracoccus sp. SCSIO 75233]|uniref:nucleotidyltransferase family protein n=1 Tax=Paracoccus sp. SCSIO 75233 TaxID=3017782 RepID=UPI0022F0040F|nr:nucleotidyltransferase family protein [Paracoccus sp. SCSIO 75233]WBU52799.1 nucleotidyltransferase family protein [Paracoccus sp. SCSIO 75233]
MTTAGILLAAGLSRRFGVADKLVAPLRGRPLVTHAAATLRTLAPEMLIAVTSNEIVAAELDGFVITQPDEATASQSASLRAGITLAGERGAQRALVMLGDMPGVTVGLAKRIAQRCTDRSPAAASDGRSPKPPACFPAACFSALLDVQGDQGARALLRSLPTDNLIFAEPGELRDIDTLHDLEEAERYCG